MLIKKIFLISSLFALPFISNGQEESAPKVDPNKSWGVGVNIGDGWDYLIGFKAYFQKKKNQFDLNIYTDFYYYDFDIGYVYYPNNWKKRADLRIMINASPYYYKEDYTTLKGASIYVGTGIRLRCLKHFYLTGSIQLGERFYHSSRLLYTGNHYYMNAAFRGELGVSINMNSFRWKRN